MPLLTGWPTDAGDGSVSTEERWRKMAQLWAPSGVVDGYLDRLDPDLSGSTVTVGAGGAWIDGHYAEQLTSSSVSVTSNGLVVIRFTPADNVFELLYRDGATTPTQTDATWELPIAQMSGGAMTDLREFVTRGTVTTRMLEPESVTYSRLAGDAVAPFFDTGGDVTNTNTTLTGSYQQTVTAAFAKPPSWGTYHITVWGAAAVEALSAETISIRASAGSNNGSDRAVEVGGGLHMEVGIRAKFTGLTESSFNCSVDVRRDSAGTATVESAIVSFLAIRVT